MTKNLTKTILSMDSKDLNLVTVKDLDSITKYNIKQLVDYLNKNMVSKQILIKEKFDVKAEVEEEKDDVMERDTFQTMNKLINDENEEETSLKGNMQVVNERQLPVKDFNVEERVQRNDHRDQQQEVHHLCAARYLVQKQLRARRNAFSSITPIWKCTLATWSSIESST